MVSCRDPLRFSYDPTGYEVIDQESIPGVAFPGEDLSSGTYWISQEEVKCVGFVLCVESLPCTVGRPTPRKGVRVLLADTRKALIGRGIDYEATNLSSWLDP